MKNFSKLTFLSFVCCAAMCSSQDEPTVISKEYESCCGTKPVEFSFEKKEIYMPNAFTPNKDGVNDYFFPVVNDVVTDVWGFAIFDTKDSMIYQKPHFFPKADIKTYGWNGLDEDGKPYKGLFKYKMRLDDRYANKYILEGHACAIVCGPESKMLVSKEGCYYPAQAGKSGNLDKSIANADKGCF